MEVPPVASSLDVEPSSVALSPGDTVGLEATPVNDESDRVPGYEIIWTGGDTTVATVNDEGIVSGLQAGTTTVTATANKEGVDTISGESEVSVDTGPGQLIEALDPGSYEQDTLREGTALYVDRDFTVEEVPSSFEGWTFVQTAGDDKTIDADSAVTFTLTEEATVAVTYDERASSRPGWLDDWTSTGQMLRTSDVNHDIFARVFGPGEVVLGGNQSGGSKGPASMYVLFASRSASIPDPQTGSLDVNTATSGDDQNPDGYTATIDGSTAKEIGPNGSVTFSGLDEGDHQVELTGVAENCSIEGSNPRTVSVEPDNTMSTSYSVGCTSTTGTLEVSASTSGDDQDSDGYAVSVDGDAPKEIGPNGSVIFSGLSDGDHSVGLTNIQTNCAVDGQNPRAVPVDAGSTASTTFGVSCETVSGPTVQSATIDSEGSQITLAFDQAVTLGPNHEDAHLNPIDDTPYDNPTMSYASGDSTSSLVFDLSRPFLKGESPSIHYDQPASGIQASENGADLPTFSEFGVTNNSMQGSPLDVSASTSGDDPDTDGYTVTVDGDGSKEIGPNGSVTFSDLGVGDHQFELSGVKANCSVEGPNPRTVSVEPDDNTSVSFDVNCAATTGSLEVSASTSGDDQDPNGYTATVDDSTSKDIGPNGSVTFSSLDASDHQVELSGIASNCSVDGENPRAVTVEGGNTASISFSVSCTATTGSLDVSASTSGDDQDSDGYTATVDGNVSKDIGPNGTATFSGLDAGDYQVELSSIQSNCSVDGQNPRTVTIETGSTVSTSFSISCTATNGSLQVSASTSGDGQDSDGYTVTVDGSSSKDVGPNGSATFSGLDEGDHTVELSGIAPNCSVDGSNPKIVTVVAGNTVFISFDVSCTGGIQAVEIPSQSDFTDQGVILDPGDCGEWDWWFTNTLGAVKRDGTLYLYYQAADGDRDNGECSDAALNKPRNRFTGVATSTDNRSFTKSSANPIIMHQPSGGVDEGLSGEGGTLLGDPLLEDDGTIRLYIGGMEETSFENVDADIVHYESSDGKTFTNQADVKTNGFSPYADENFTSAAIKIDGTYYLYYTGQGGGATDWTLHVVNGDAPDADMNGTETKVAGPGDGNARGQHGSPTRISEDTILMPISDAFGGMDASIDLRMAPVSDPSDLSTLEDSWDFSGEHVVPVLMLDREAEEWLLFYQRGKGHDRWIRLKTAPVTYVD